MQANSSATIQSRTTARKSGSIGRRRSSSRSNPWGTVHVHLLLPSHQPPRIVRNAALAPPSKLYRAPRPAKTLANKPSTTPGSSACIEHPLLLHIPTGFELLPLPPTAISTPPTTTTTTVAPELRLRQPTEMTVLSMVDDLLAECNVSAMVSDGYSADPGGVFGRLHHQLQLYGHLKTPLVWMLTIAAMNTKAFVFPEFLPQMCIAVCQLFHTVPKVEYGSTSPLPHLNWDAVPLYCTQRARLEASCVVPHGDGSSFDWDFDLPDMANFVSVLHQLAAASCQHVPCRRAPTYLALTLADAFLHVMVLAHRFGMFSDPVLVYCSTLLTSPGPLDLSSPKSVVVYMIAWLRAHPPAHYLLKKHGIYVERS